MKQLRIALAQINPTVGALDSNAKKIITYINRAQRQKADLIAFPELAITGYPPEDLLLKPRFITDNLNVLDKIYAACHDMTAIVGFVDRRKDLYNAAAIISNNTIVGAYHKKHLPNYGVFDEHRYFRAGRKYPVFNLNGIKLGVNICEDIWHEKGPALIQSLAGAEVIININASPYFMDKSSLRESILADRADECGTPIVYVNMTGGQDELVFDGGSLVIGKDGTILARGDFFREELITIDLELPDKKKAFSGPAGKKMRASLLKNKNIVKVKIPAQSTHRIKPAIRQRKHRKLMPEHEVYSALVMGTKDYVNKNGFNGVVIGMSGGIDSALVTTIAVDALGHANVHGIFMPSMYSSQDSFEDAHSHAKNLGIKFTTIPITGIYDTYIKTLSASFRATEPDITEENLQARIRGNILMALSNKFGWLVLTTGNKSEMSVGYATLYGDMAGGFAVIKDVPKTLVYDL